MKLQHLVIAAAACSVAWTSTSHATVEITSSLSPPGIAGFLGQSGPIGAVNLAFGGSSNVTSVGLGAGVGFFASPTFEILVNPGFTLMSAGGGTITLLSLTAGPVFNFDSDVSNSPFVFAAPGIMSANGGGASSTNFEFTVALGKRFALNPHVSYTPTISYTGVTSSPFISSIGITPVQFSLFI